MMKVTATNVRVLNITGVQEANRVDQQEAAAAVERLQVEKKAVLGTIPSNQPFHGTSIDIPEAGMTIHPDTRVHPDWKTISEEFAGDDPVLDQDPLRWWEALILLIWVVGFSAVGILVIVPVATAGFIFQGCAWVFDQLWSKQEEGGTVS